MIIYIAKDNYNLIMTALENANVLYPCPLYEDALNSFKRNTTDNILRNDRIWE